MGNTPEILLRKTLFYYVESDSWLIGQIKQGGILLQIKQKSLYQTIILETISMDWWRPVMMLSIL